MDSNKLEDGSFWGWIEKGIYKFMVPVDVVFRLEIPLSIALERNQNRSKTGKETDLEIEQRFKLFSKTKYHSKKTVTIENTRKPINAIETILSELI